MADPMLPSAVEAAAHHSPALIESMLRSLTNGVVTVGLDGVVTYMNPAASRILRLDDSAIGQPLADIFEGFNAWVVEAIEEANASGEEKLLPNSEFFIAAEDREFRREVQRAQEKRIWTSFPSSAWMAWNGVLKPRHLRGVRLAVRTISWMS